MSNPGSSAMDIWSFETNWLRLDLDSKGQIVSIYDLPNGKEYLASDHGAPVLRVAVGGVVHDPASVSYNEEAQVLKLVYGSGGITAQVEVSVKPTHLTLELKSIQGADAAMIMWGPYPTTIYKTVGETVGVVRNDEFAFGIQALNVQTIGGRPKEYPDLGVGGENDAAARTDSGSAVQAYAREYDGGAMGSKIALFGCLVEKALETIEQIEIAEGLPHPLLDGEWGKTPRGGEAQDSG